eukprot:CAMPEP_0168616074 /NCGR_PEP_ID=MMETSP0449_2-20121227/4840_1 /TAXON_ID=1082188 /ORGANISM="Strombidium rassoulzadegani, Strain ras09" /LENGTH=303 /DNA_ID=CAMNT_0008656849 /DNA_START=336 /DNA_END=1244 /DNA_ORIENTATION=+
MEEGIAHLFLVTKQTSKLKAKIEKHISKKKAFGQKVEQQKNKFYEQIENALEVNFNVRDHGDALLKSIKAMVIGSPGSYKDHLFKYLNEAADKKKSPLLKELLSKTILTHCSSGFKHSLNEIMHNKEVENKIQDVGCYSESQVLDQFFEELRTTENKVCYGLNSVKYAMENMAVEKLLISDHLFRSKNNMTRKMYVQLSESAERQGVDVVIFGSLSPSGERLKQMTGVAAILRFELPGLDDVEELNDSDSEKDSDELSAYSNGSKSGKEAESDDDQIDSKKLENQGGFDQEQLDILMNGGYID